MAMSAEGIKPMASLDAAMLGRRSPARRVPLSFAPTGAPENLLNDDQSGAEVPEVVRQVERLARALGVGPVGDPPCTEEPARCRVAFTLRLDADRHGQLRRIALAQGRSAQQVLIAALDHYSAGATAAAAIPAMTPSPSNVPTGNQP